MSSSQTAIDTLSAQWYNTLVAALKLSASEFQIAQGDLTLPQNTTDLWLMIDQIPEASTNQYYTSATLNTFSSGYKTILSDTFVAANQTFEDAMGEANMSAWKAAKLAYCALATTGEKMASNPPSSTTNTLLAYFNSWSAINMDNPSQAANCATLYADCYNSPIYVGNTLMTNLASGESASYSMTLASVKQRLGDAPSVKFSMNSSQASSDISSSWATSSNSAGGSYFYSTASSSQSSDFTQTFATSDVIVTTEYEHVTNIQMTPLSAGTISDGTTTYAAWCYPGALTAAYQDKTGDTWTNPANWEKFFGPSGSMQYLIVGLIIADGITQTTTSSATFSKDEQTYCATQTSSGYGCWPYYVKSNNSSSVSTSTHFNDDSTMTVTTTSPVGHPVVIGVLVSTTAAEET